MYNDFHILFVKIMREVKIGPDTSVVPHQGSLLVKGPSGSDWVDEPESKLLEQEFNKSVYPQQPPKHDMKMLTCLLDWLVYRDYPKPSERTVTIDFQHDARALYYTVPWGTFFTLWDETHAYTNNMDGYCPFISNFCNLKQQTEHKQLFTEKQWNCCYRELQTTCEENSTQYIPMYPTKLTCRLDTKRGSIVLSTNEWSKAIYKDTEVEGDLLLACVLMYAALRSHYTFTIESAPGCFTVPTVPTSSNTSERVDEASKMLTAYLKSKGFMYNSKTVDEVFRLLKLSHTDLSSFVDLMKTLR